MEPVAFTLRNETLGTNRKRLCWEGNAAIGDGILLRIGRNTFPDKKVNPGPHADMTQYNTAVPYPVLSIGHPFLMSLVFHSQE